MNVSPFAVKMDEYRGIYTSRYAYVKNLTGAWFLYDNIEDPFQLKNLAGNPEYTDIQKMLESSLQNELKKIGDDFQPGEYYLKKWYKPSWIEYDSKDKRFQTGKDSAGGIIK